MELLGTVVRLQVQRAPLKPGTAPYRTYHTEPILGVAAWRVDADGVRGLVDDEWVLDVHHPGHPRSRHRGCNGISISSVADAAVLRDRFGPHLVDGAAGEGLLLDTDRPLAGRDLSGGLMVETADGTLPLTRVEPAVPCIEFTRFCLGRPGPQPDEQPVVDDLLRRELAWLEGRRGFLAVPEEIDEPRTVRPGARAWLRT